ncbi:MAG: hypothetical protein P4L85_28095 [Paludisphaera borealis]|uniref:hypothetical protein n=1 Tax=Paludisphaera borealis TaxID=1387353 RepID=UPI00284E1863|nr:hypothetical protein [Paludisphaera borealis]MDR3623248.1 hypothetical protein [Paludisphaera borealis]
MNSPWLAANLDDPTALESLSAEIRAWDPAFDLYRPASDALLYEPDGTLYAIALQAPMTAEYNHRKREVRPGDLLIVPSGLPVGIEPAVDLLGLRFEGEPPDHFRERFLQVWGYEHLPAVEGGEIVADADLRFPLSYAVRWIEESTELPPGSSSLGRCLLIALEGTITIEAGDGDRATVELAPRDALLTDGGGDLVVRGPGRLAVLRVEPEIVFSARRAASRRAGTQATPEYLPPSPQPSGS